VSKENHARIPTDEEIRDIFDGAIGLGLYNTVEQSRNSDNKIVVWTVRAHSPQYDDVTVTFGEVQYRYTLNTTYGGEILEYTQVVSCEIDASGDTIGEPTLVASLVNGQLEFMV